MTKFHWKGVKSFLDFFHVVSGIQLKYFAEKQHFFSNFGAHGQYVQQKLLSKQRILSEKTF